jgi:hypothetical protein
MIAKHTNRLAQKSSRRDAVRNRPTFALSANQLTTQRRSTDAKQRIANAVET